MHLVLFVEKRGVNARIAMRKCAARGSGIIRVKLAAQLGGEIDGPQVRSHVVRNAIRSIQNVYSIEIQTKLSQIIEVITCLNI